MLRYLPVDGSGRLDLSDLDRTLRGARLVAVSAMSNVLGTINPLRLIADAAHAEGAVVVADGAQSVPHLPVDVGELGVDFLAFSAHKMLGPTGIGVLWARTELLDAMPPFLGGGGMILDVRLDRFLPAEPPQRFEAGTPPIAEAVGLAAAIDYLGAVGIDRVRDHERALTAYAIEQLHEQLGERPAHLRSARRATTGAGCSRSPTATSTPTTWPRCSTSSGCASGPATTAPSPSCASWACRPPPGRRSASTTTSTTSTS